MAYHVDFWMAVTATAPVLALAHAVVVQRTVVEILRTLLRTTGLFGTP